MTKPRNHPNKPPAPPPNRKWISLGAVTKFGVATMEEICREVAVGKKSMDEICDRPGMPSPSTVWKMAATSPECAALLNEAREISAHALEEEALNLARFMMTPSFRDRYSKDQINALNFAMQQYRWSAGKRNPRTYSDKFANSGGVTIHIETNLDLDRGEVVPGVFEVVADLPQLEDKSGA